jgi:Uma2 family endonuclease
MATTIIQSDYERERGKPTPSKNHAFVQTRLIVAFATQFTQYQVLSELSLQLGTSEKVPDLAIFKNIQFTPGNDEIRVEQTPLAVIEILSPKQNLGDLLAKAHTYFENGIGSYWLVLPDLKSIYVFSSPFESEVYTHKDILKDEVLGIELELKGIFG